MSKPLSRSELEAGDAELAASLVSRGRAAMAEIDNVGQPGLDEAVTALAWSHYRPENAQELAETAVRSTGLGNVSDKIEKIRRKTFGTLRDLSRVKSTGVIEEITERGVVKFAKPVGVVAAICPSTNPASTAVNKAMMAIKGGNAIVLAPSPLGWTTTARSAELMREELARTGKPVDLIQVLPQPVVKSNGQGRSVAQPGSASDWGSGGRGFKSRRSDHYVARSALTALISWSRLNGLAIMRSAPSFSATARNAISPTRPPPDMAMILISPN